MKDFITDKALGFVTLKKKVYQANKQLTIN